MRPLKCTGCYAGQAAFDNFFRKPKSEKLQKYHSVADLIRRYFKYIAREPWFSQKSSKAISLKDVREFLNELHSKDQKVLTKMNEYKLKRDNLGDFWELFRPRQLLGTLTKNRHYIR